MRPAGHRGKRLQPGCGRQHGWRAVAEVGARPDKRVHVSRRSQNRSSRRWRRSRRRTFLRREDFLCCFRLHRCHLRRLAPARALPAVPPPTPPVVFPPCSADAAGVVPGRAAALVLGIRAAAASWIGCRHRWRRGVRVRSNFRAASYQQSRQGCREKTPGEAFVSHARLSGCKAHEFSLAIKHDGLDSCVVSPAFLSWVRVLSVRLDLL